VALVILALLGSGIGQLVNAHTDQRKAAEKMAAKFGQKMTQEQLDEAVQRAKNPSPVLRAVSIVTGFLFQSLFYLLPTLLFYVFFKLSGSDLTFKGGLSTYLHASVPIMIGILLTIPVVLSRATVEPVDALTGRLLASGPAFLLPEGTSLALRGALSAFDAFNLWSVALIIVGYRIVARVSTTAATVAAVLIFLLGMGFRAGMAAFLG
jgi:hypothetical protein